MNAADASSIPRHRSDWPDSAAAENSGTRDVSIGRQFAAWIGLTPKDHSTAGKVRLGVITRASDEALRQRVSGWGDRRHPTCTFPRLSLASLCSHRVDASVRSRQQLIPFRQAHQDQARNPHLPPLGRTPRSLEGPKEVEDGLLIRRREPLEIRYDRIGFRRRKSRCFW
jgi:hypothetical protein